jgi:PAS domain S-box-containing protein
MATGGVWISSPPERPAWLRYGAAVLSVGIGWAGRTALTGALGPTALPFIFFFPLIALAAWFGGFGPGVLATVLSAAIADYFFFEPLHTWVVHPRERWAFGAFGLAAFAILGAIESMHRAKAKLAASRDLLATTFSSIGDGVIVTDDRGRVTSLNSVAERLTGWKSAEAVGQPLSSVFRIVNEVTRKAAENPADKVLAQGTVVGLANHTVLVARDGTEFPIDDSAAPIRAPGGPLLGVVLVFRDASAERKAQADRARLAAIVESSGDAILSQTVEGKILTWNAAAERLLGYKPEEAVGKSVTFYIPKELKDEEGEILSRVSKGELVERLETYRIAKDGRRVPVSLRVSPIKDSEGRVIGSSKTLHDISDILAAREALAKERNLLQTTLASIGDGVIVTDDRGLVSFMNAEAERLTGWKSSEARGRDLPSVFRIVNEETRKSVENPVEKVLRLGQVVGLANHTILLAKDGREVPIDDSAAPIREPGGPLYGVVLVFRDFSEHKKAEAAAAQARQDLARANASLEEAVQERTAKLREMVEELQHVSYSITHDMRAPLRAMSSFSEMLLESAATLPAESQDYCRRIMTGAARLDRLIQDALSYSRAVLQDVPLESVDLARLIKGLLETYPNFHPEKADIAVEGQLPAVLGNEALLTQCFSNLLGNAVKFVAPGTRPRVRVRSEIQDGVARIWIEDNGIGIPTEARNRLFGMFQKLDNQYEGTGIGLAIVRKVVERMGGQVGLDSDPGDGSRFWVDLRRAPEGVR